MEDSILVQETKKAIGYTQIIQTCSACMHCTNRTYGEEMYHKLKCEFSIIAIFDVKETDSCEKFKSK